MELKQVTQAEFKSHLLYFDQHGQSDICPLCGQRNCQVPSGAQSCAPLEPHHFGLDVVADVVVNLTQHQPTDSQSDAGVVASTVPLGDLLTIPEMEAGSEMARRAIRIVEAVTPQLQSIIMAGRFPAVMIGGHPALTALLHKEFELHGIRVAYAFSRRESVEIQHDDGRVEKQNVFRHLGFTWFF